MREDFRQTSIQSEGECGGGKTEMNVGQRENETEGGVVFFPVLQISGFPFGNVKQIKWFNCDISSTVGATETLTLKLGGSLCIFLSQTHAPSSWGEIATLMTHYYF